MGTTLVCLIIKNSRFTVGHIGDSRAYLLRSGEMRRLTRDHTYLEELSSTASEPIPDSIVRQYSSVLNHSLDGGNDQPDILPMEELQLGDAFLLCSDGMIINKLIASPQYFRDCIIGTRTLERAAKTLIALAYNEGSSDNITVVLGAAGRLKRKSASDAQASISSPGEGPHRGSANSLSKIQCTCRGNCNFYNAGMAFALALPRSLTCYKNRNSHFETCSGRGG